MTAIRLGLMPKRETESLGDILQKRIKEKIEEDEICQGHRLEKVKKDIEKYIRAGSLTRYAHFSVSSLDSERRRKILEWLHQSKIINNNSITGYFNGDKLIINIEEL